MYEFWKNSSTSRSFRITLKLIVIKADHVLYLLLKFQVSTINYFYLINLLVTAPQKRAHQRTESFENFQLFTQLSDKFGIYVN
jgi:hypothetical protein